MKKIVLVLCVVTLSLSLCACGVMENMQSYKSAEELYAAGDFEAAAAAYESIGEYKDSAEKAKACRYELARVLMAAEEYHQAAELFEALESYSDSAEMAENCRREIGMRENADYAFLEDLQTAITESILNIGMFQDEHGAYDYFNAELELVGKYSEESFYDARLADIALRYINSVDRLRSAYSYDDMGDIVLNSLEASSVRYAALNELYENYGFMADNMEFVELFVDQNPVYQRTYKAVAEIMADFESQVEQLNHPDLVAEDAEKLTLTFVNNTSHTFGLIYGLTVYDVHDIVYDETFYDLPVDRVDPGAAYELSLDLKHPEKYWRFECDMSVKYVDNAEIIPGYLVEFAPAHPNYVELDG